MVFLFCHHFLIPDSNKSFPKQGAYPIWLFYITTIGIYTFIIPSFNQLHLLFDTIITLISNDGGFLCLQCSPKGYYGTHFILIIYYEGDIVIVEFRVGNK